ncbi:Sodium-dependent phosphate transport protein 1 [Aphelenchoides besseyi]|nr:Sodium-dependent phosphate transport protein 1 [Aphelenchoides besseyi]
MSLESNTEKKTATGGHELILGAYPDVENPIVRMSTDDVRRVSLASLQKSRQKQLDDLKLNSGNSPPVFANRTRHLILVLATACLTMVMANSLALNFTVICMFKDENNENDQITLINGTGSKNELSREFMFNDVERSYLFSSIAVGTIAGTIPISYLNNRFGLRRTFTFYGLTSAISTLLIPLGASYGFYIVLFLRMVEGFAVATSFPAMGSIATNWSPLKRSGTFVAYLSTHLQLGTIITMPLAGELCGSQLGWQSLYYILGVTTFLLFVSFYLFYRDSPSMHRNVSAKELTKLQEGKVIRVVTKDERSEIPYRSIFTDPSVLGVIASCIGGSLGFQLFFQFGPLYLNKILKFDVQNTGFAAALPSVFSMLLKFVAGPLSDNVPCLSERWRVILFASISQFAMAACFAALAFLPENSPMWGQLFYTGAIVFSGLNCVGVSKSVTLISGPFSYILMAVSQFVMSVAILILPLIVTVFAPDNTPEEWARLFIFTAILVAVVTMIFNLTAKASLRPWAYTGSSTQPSPKTTSCDQTRKIAPESDHFDIDYSKIGDLSRVEQLLTEKRLSVISRNESLRKPANNSTDGTTNNYLPSRLPPFTETVKLEKVDI